MIGGMNRYLPLVIDLVLVVIFAAVGRASHGLNALGILSTAWPFLLACLIGWIVVQLAKFAGTGLRAGLAMALVTWLGGIGIRLLSGNTADPAFILVAGATLTLFQLGWRIIHHLVSRRRRTAAA